MRARQPRWDVAKCQGETLQECKGEDFRDRDPGSGLAGSRSGLCIERGICPVNLLRFLLI